MYNRLAKLAGLAVLWKGGQLVGVKVIYLARTLILARLLLPEDFGLLAISMIAIDFLINITDVGMLPALVQRVDAKAHHYDAAWTVGVVRALIITVVVFLGAPVIAALFTEPRATDLIRVIAFRPLLEALVSIRVAELTRNLQFRSITFIQLSEAIINTTLSIALASTLGVWAMIIGYLAGSTARVISSYILAPYRPRLCFDQSAIKPLINYGRWIFLTGLIVVAGSTVLQIIISRRLGTTELGLYFLADKLAALPSEIATEVLGAVIFPLYAHLQTDLQKAAQAFRAILAGMWALLFPMCLLLIILAPSLVQNVLGARWEGTVLLIRLFAVVTIITLTGEIISPILKGMGQPSKVAVLEGVQTIILVAMVGLLIDRFGVSGAVLAWWPAGAASLLISVWFLNRILPRPFAGLHLPLLLITGAAVGGAVVALGLDHLISGLPGFVIAGLLAMVTIGGLLLAFERRFNLGLTDYLIRAFPGVARLARLSGAHR